MSIIECASCTFAWQYPLGRTEKQSVEWFNAAYADKGKTESAYFDPDRKREIAKLEFEFVAKLPNCSKTLLDLGAGAGVFAEIAAEHGWTVTAVDPALDVDQLKTNPRIKAIKGTIGHVPNGDLFSVATLWDVIEHATAPIELIDNVKRYIQPGGWLVIETGNYKSVERLLEGTRHWIYQLDHRWYFSPDSIKHVLNEAGFSEFILAEKVLRPGWSGTRGYTGGPGKADLAKSMLRDPLHFPMHLSNHLGVRKAKSWDMAGISIFAIAARMAA